MSTGGLALKRMLGSLPCTPTTVVTIFNSPLNELPSNALKALPTAKHMIKSLNETQALCKISQILTS